MQTSTSRHAGQCQCPTCRSIIVFAKHDESFRCSYCHTLMRPPKQRTPVGKLLSECTECKTLLKTPGSWSSLLFSVHSFLLFFYGFSNFGHTAGLPEYGCPNCQLFMMAGEVDAIGTTTHCLEASRYDEYRRRANVLRVFKKFCGLSRRDRMKGLESLPMTKGKGHSATDAGVELPPELQVPADNALPRTWIAKIMVFLKFPAKHLLPLFVSKEFNEFGGIYFGEFVELYNIQIDSMWPLAVAALIPSGLEMQRGLTKEVQASKASCTR